jgi:hypothetical protein
MKGREAYIFLLLMHMSNLEPDVLFIERPRRIGDNVFEALEQESEHSQAMRDPTYLQTLLKLRLLLVDDAEAEVYLVRLLEVWLHTHNLREGFFGVLQRAIAVIKDPNAVP